MPAAIRDPSSRAVRVFVSSTFSDMEEERDELLKRVFPALRKRCERRGITLDEVDLRWGITDGEVAEGKVLPRCLALIRDCRPYFLGILGERYGCDRISIPRDLGDQQPWLAEHTGRSVTELEILHGVLNDPAMAAQSFFYFRSPAYIDTLPEERRGKFREDPRDDEVEELGPEAASQRAAERRARLAALKERIRASGVPVCENYADPGAFRLRVEDDLNAVIDRLFPEGSAPSALDRETAAHQAFARVRTRVYVGASNYFPALDRHALGPGPPLVVAGEPGCGKTALLAKWSDDYRARHRERILVAHFIGATEESTDWVAMLRRLLGELGRRLDLVREIPESPEALRAAFAGALQVAAGRGGAIVLIDALDQLEDRDQAPDLAWLPRDVPPGVRLVVSTRAGRPLDEIERRGWPLLHVRPLTDSERGQVVVDHLAQYGRSLSSEHLELLIGGAQCGNPLFLRTVLEELRIWGSHERLRERIEHYRSAGSIDDLFERVLARYEEDYEDERPGLVRDAFSLLTAARRGLSESELLELLGPDGEPLPFARWSPLLFAADASLVNRSGLLGFFHDELRKAVRDRYLPTAEHRRAVHLRLADYFAARDPGPRRVEELPWQLARSEAWDRLAELLAERELFEAIRESSELDLRRYWTELEARSEHRSVDVYMPRLDGPIEHHEHVWNVGLLLGSLGETASALQLQRRLIEHFRSTGRTGLLSGTLGNSAGMMMGLGAYAGALPLLEEQEQIARAAGDWNLVAHALSSRARALTVEGDRRLAGLLLDQAATIAREIGNRPHLAYYLGNRAALFAEEDDLASARPLFEEQERICRDGGDWDGLALALENQARALQTAGDSTAALRRLEELEGICGQIGLLSNLGRALRLRAEIELARGQEDRAWATLTERLTVAERVGDGWEVVHTLLTQTVILRRRGDLEGAVERSRAAYRLTRELADPGSGTREAAGKVLQQCLGTMAIASKNAGRLDQAMALLGEQEEVCRAIGEQWGLQAALGDRANLLHRSGDLAGALRLHDEEERICRELGDRDALQGALGNRGGVLVELDRFEEALALFREKERLGVEIGNSKAVATALANQAMVLAGPLGRPEEALPLAEHAAELAARSDLGPRSLEIRMLLLDLRGRVHAR